MGVVVFRAVFTPSAESLSVEEIALAEGCSLRTARRRVARWHARQWPHVRRVAVNSRKWEYVVDGASYDAFCRGERPAEDLAA